MIFKSRFNPHPPAPSHPTVKNAKLTAEYIDRVDLSGKALSLADLRHLVHSVQDWPDDAEVRVAETSDMGLSMGVPDIDRIYVKVRENR